MKIIALLCVVASVASASPISYWTFDDDAAGLGIKNTTDSGSQAANTKWSVDTVAQGHRTDGEGHFILNGDALPRYCALTDLSGNAAAYNPAYTSGIYRMEFNFASWELDTATAGKVFLAARSGATEIARIEFFVAGTNTVAVQWNNEGGEYRQRTFSWTNSALSLATELDFDNDTARYFLGEEQIGDDFAFNVAQMDNFRYAATGWNGSSNETVKIDSMGLSSQTFWLTAPGRMYPQCPTGHVEAAFSSGISSNPVQITDITFNNETHPGAFASLTSVPLELTDPLPSNALLTIRFDPVAGGVASGDVASSDVVVSWNDGGATRQSMCTVTGVNKPFIERGRVGSLDGYVVADSGERLRGGDFRVLDTEASGMAANYDSYEAYFKEHVMRGHLNVVRISARYPDYNRDPADFAYGVMEAIKWCKELGVYACLNLHTYYGQSIDVAAASAFWDYFANLECGGVALKDDPNVFFELVNEPIDAALGDKMEQLYTYVRGVAPETHLVLFSCANPGQSDAGLLDQLTGIEWSNASVGFHAYDNDPWNRADGIHAAGYPVFCTEMDSGTDDGALMYNVGQAESRSVGWMHWAPKVNWANAVANDFLFGPEYFHLMAEADIAFWGGAGEFTSAQDIGEVGAFGEVAHDDGTYTIEANGAGIGLLADEFLFVHREFNPGDGDLVARVDSIEASNAQSGIMMRETLKAGSRNVAVLVSPTGGVSMQSRSSNDGTTTSIPLAGHVPPCWVKLSRSGDAFSGYVSGNGADWTLIGSETVSMNDSIRAGLAASSRNDGTNSTTVITVEPPPVFGFVPVSYWTFEKDGSDTGLQNAVDSGSQAANTMWSDDTPVGQRTDGAGSFVISGDTETRWIQLVDLSTNEAAYNPACTSGVFRFEVNFASWMIGDATDGDFAFIVRDGATDVAKIEFNVLGANSVQVQWSNEGGDFRQRAYTGTNGAVSASIEFDFDNDTAKYYVDTGSGDVQVGIDFLFTAAQVNNLRYGVRPTWNGSAADTLKIDSMGLAAWAQVPPTPESPTEFYDSWIAGYSVGANTNLLDHGDSDGLVNLTEYALGGDPSDGSSRGNMPVQSVLSGATNLIEYIYFERTNAVELGLASILEVGTDLVDTNWANGSSYEVGRGASADAGFNAVTNWVPTDEERQRFIRLKVEFTP